MSKPTPNLTADDRDLMRLVVQAANIFRDKFMRLNTIDEKMAQDFLTSTFDTAELMFAVWHEGDTLGFLLIKEPSGVMTNSDGVVATWVENRAIAEGLKKKMKEEVR